MDNCGSPKTLLHSDLGQGRPFAASGCSCFHKHSFNLIVHLWPRLNTVVKEKKCLSSSLFPSHWNSNHNYPKKLWHSNDWKEIKCYDKASHIKHIWLEAKELLVWKQNRQVDDPEETFLLTLQSTYSNCGVCSDCYFTPSQRSWLTLLPDQVFSPAFRWFYSSFNLTNWTLTPKIFMTKTCSLQLILSVWLLVRVILARTPH